MRLKQPLASVQAVRKALNFTCQECADALGVAEQTYSRIERGVQRMYADQLLKLSDLFDLDPRTLDRPLALDERVNLMIRGEKRRDQRERAKAEGRTLAEVVGLDRQLEDYSDPVPAPAPAKPAKPVKPETPKQALARAQRAASDARLREAGVEPVKYAPHGAPGPRDEIQWAEWKQRACAGQPPVDDGEAQYRRGQREAGYWMVDAKAAATTQATLETMRAPAPELQAPDQELADVLADWADFGKEGDEDYVDPATLAQ